ncbi:hypothetical protein [Nodosilinea sp. E11]|uniref:hypothetical protein n=1 Tax=Nodosilinea sp. E11 TaxID=3037479 RepID=UPI0029352566|nr:hypothetical protein [Nodosilinea sp. E11]WOD41735.1 hypothetical protein RRF56_13135 [Nodosilinea sp. E11]
MAPKKLTEADKTSILSLYRQPQETTSTLADRYGVSNSTISRLLKASLPEAEYSLLIQQKRGASERSVPGKAALEVVMPDDRTEILPPVLVEPEASSKPQVKRRQKTVEPVAEPVAEPVVEPVAEPAIAVTLAADPEAAAVAAEAPAPSPKPTRKRRSRLSETAADSPPDDSAEPEVEAPPEVTQLSLTEPVPDPAAPPEKPARPVLKSAQSVPAAAKSSNDETADDLDDDWDDNPVLGDDYDEDDSDDDDDGDDDDANTYAWEGGDRGSTPHLETLEIAPLTADVLPPLCYVVVERTSSELVVLPLRTFAELGQIPETEGDSRTLPVFENHNVARRFSRRNQRVVKVPDGTLLQTTSPYLQAKGITRLFIDGQVFSLGQDDLESVAPLGED